MILSKILVTGGCGFIGSALVDVLHRHTHEVHVVDDLSLGKDYWIGKSDRPQLHVQDILDATALDALFEKINPDIVFHLAAHHFIPLCENNPYDAYRLNVGGTLNVLESCRKTRVKQLFFASTGDVYPPAFTPHREVDTVSPIYVYGHTKIIAEQICIKFFETHLVDSSLIIGRIFNATGRRETNPHLIPEVVKQITEGKRVVEVGNLWPKRDFVDVDSMAEVIANLTFNSSGIELVNIGSGEVQEIGQVLELLKAAAPHPVDVVSIPERRRPNDRPFLCPDVTRLKRLNGTPAKPFSASTARLLFAEASNRTTATPQ
jgi:UDP-glucose 4-epimerase